MKKVILALSFLASIAANAASISPTDRLYCYAIGSESAAVLEASSDGAGLVRDFTFKKHAMAKENLITSRCEMDGELLVCKSKKVEIRVDTSSTEMTETLRFEDARPYFKAELTRTTLFGRKITAPIQCYSL